ncbi:MAG: hypothetical protein H6835_21105 [Planctomycetes bacterium]|nr:hypothetical protein [Planctomycetota bacterium]
MRRAVLLALLPAGGAFAQEPAAEAAREAPAPIEVTAATRADAKALARLQQPGRVLFHDEFEADASFRSYFEIQGQKEGRVAIERDAAIVHGGLGALRLTSTSRDGASCGAGPVLWLPKVIERREGEQAPSLDTVHLRYWIRYAADYDQGNLHHTGGSLSGVAGDFMWTGMGGAGKCPPGDESFSTRVEGWRDWQRLPPPGYLHCYSYWHEMRRGNDGHYWGNMLTASQPEQRVVPERAKWQCVELRVAANTVGDDGAQRDGELAVWLDGALYLHFTGIAWRTSAAVLLKRVGLLCYVHEARRDNTVWFDDVVVATGYIGPGEPARSDAAK